MIPGISSRSSRLLFRFGGGCGWGGSACLVNTQTVITKNITSDIILLSDRDKPHSRFLYLLEVTTKSIAALVSGSIMNNRWGLSCHSILIFFTFRSWVLVVLSHWVVLLPLLTPVYMVFQLYSYLPLCWLISIKIYYLFRYLHYYTKIK